MKALMGQLKQSGALRSERIAEAFEAIDRKDFIPAEYEELAYEDRPLLIGYGQTISQPTTVAFMLELLDPRSGQTIADIGSGSGWQTALLAYIVGKTGRVVAVEVIPELLKQAQRSIAPYQFSNITWLSGSAWDPLPVTDRFDRIIIAAASQEVPPQLLKRLKVGGRLVAPLGLEFSQDIVVFEKQGEDRYATKPFPGFVFVPLVKK